MKTNKKIIFIDWNKTLSYSLFWGQLKEKDSLTYEKIEKWLFVDNRTVINPWMKGTIKSEQIIKDMSNDIDVSYTFLLEEFIISCKKMTWAFDGVETYIKKIRKKGMKVVIATDNMDSFPEHTVPGMNISELFDDYLVSSTIGHLKDEEEASTIKFFDDYLKINNVTYHDVVLLDDSEDKHGKYKRNNFDRILIDSPETLEQHLRRYAES